MQAFRDYFSRQKKDFCLKSTMKTDENTAEIVVLVDRSGSMQHGREDFEGGINSFIQTQKEHDGQARITLVTFDTEVEVIYHGDIQECPAFKLQPRGGTALNDAMGESINTIGELLRKTDEKDRPKLITFVCSTDGGENSSREFSTKQVQDMVKHQTEKYNWSFLFLGADYDAVGNNQYASNIDNSLNFSKSKVNQVYEMTSSKLSNARTMVSQGFSADAAGASFVYTEEDREEVS